jgi:predicted RNase H-like nuclease (RuvC/YqgF family)
MNSMENHVNIDLVVNNLANQITELSKDKAIYYSLAVQRHAIIQQLKQEKEQLQQEMEQLKKENQELKKQVDELKKRKQKPQR